MKKLLLLSTLALPLGLLLTGCGDVSLPDSQAYRVALTSLGYAFSSGQYTILNVTPTLTSSANAPDVNELTYKGTLLNSKMQPAAANNSIIAPVYGTLLVGAKGGYRCTTTAEAQCHRNSADAYPDTNGTWASNTLTKPVSIVPIEWAVANNTSTDGDTAQWYVKMDYTAHTSNNKTYTWSQIYQFVSPTN